MLEGIYCAQDDLVNLGSARQSKINPSDRQLASESSNGDPEIALRQPALSSISGEAKLCPSFDKSAASRRLAKESDRIKRAREKLLARWGEEEKLISHEAIEAIKEKIKNQYHRNTSLRTRLSEEGKPLRLFAQGEGVRTSVSPRVKAVMERVRQEIEQQKPAFEKPLP